MNKSTFGVVVKEKRADGGKILITTPDVDRENDIVIPTGIDTRNYMLGGAPVMFGHSGYNDPEFVVGRTTNLEVTPAGIVADFQLRAPAHPTDKQHIVKMLWNEGYTRQASIGFRGIRSERNSYGGLTYYESELLEWSLVPVAAQPAARAIKALEGGDVQKAMQILRKGLDTSIFHNLNPIDNPVLFRLNEQLTEDQIARQLETLLGTVADLYGVELHNG